jgi:hypothetical protein
VDIRRHPSASAGLLALAATRILPRSPTHVVDFGLDPVSNRLGQFQEDIVKGRVVNLQGAAHVRA